MEKAHKGFRIKYFLNESKSKDGSKKVDGERRMKKICLNSIFAFPNGNAWEWMTQAITKFIYSS